jgi:hypothetical protein
MDQHEIDASRPDTVGSPPIADDLNKQWAARVRAQQDAQAREQFRRDDSARHAAIITTAACLVRIKHLLSRP